MGRLAGARYRSQLARDSGTVMKWAEIPMLLDRFPYPLLYRIELPVTGQIDLQRSDRYAVALDCGKIRTLAGVLSWAGRAYPINGFPTRTFRFDDRLRLVPAA